MRMTEMDESRRLAMRRAHVKHKGFCSCGKIVAGNGGRFNHAQMHKRNKDGHHYLLERIWHERLRATKPTATADGGRDG